MPSAPTARASSSATIGLSGGSVYRFVSAGAYNPLSQQELEGGAIGVLDFEDGGRAVVSADGSVQRAAQQARVPLRGGVPVPARLGGGFLFWTYDTLYRARTFLASLEGIAAISTNVIGVEFGHDFVLVLSPQAAPKAFNLERRQEVPLSPHGLTTIAGAEDERVLALDATGRALRSLDGGRSWTDVSSAVSAVAGPARGVREEGGEVAFVLDEHSGAWLLPDGRFLRRPFASVARATPEAQAAVLLQSAVGAGLKMSETTALVGDGNGTRVVDLRSGSVSAVQAAGPAGSSCVPVSLQQQGVLVCYEYGRKPQTTVISNALSAAPKLEKTFSGTQNFVFGDDILSIAANCWGAPLESAACVRQSSGVWVEVNVPLPVLRSWQPRFWVPRQGGAVLLIASERGASGSSPKAALIDPISGLVTPWDAPLDQVVPLGSGSNPASSFSVRGDGTLRGFTSHGSISVDAQGRVSRGRAFVGVSGTGAHALAHDDHARLWQTNDFGTHWQEVEPPPDTTPRDNTPRPVPNPFPREPVLNCSLLGCALAHGSGGGFWLRVGWPDDSPHPRSPTLDASHGVERTSTPVADSVQPAQRPLAKLRCGALAQEPLLSTVKPHRAPAPASSALDWADVFAGQRSLTRRGSHSFANVAYRDSFSNDPSYLAFGLRGVVHLEAPNAPILRAPSIQRQTPIETWFLEPLDPAGRIQHIRGSLRNFRAGDPPPVPAEGEPSAPGASQEAAQFDRFEGTARPLLSARPGHAAGILLMNGDLSLLASSSAQITPLSVRCSPASGYVDAQGKLFVACAEWSQATRLVQADDLSTHLRLPAAAYFRIKNSPGMTLFPPGLTSFENPDAVAVGRDGKLHVLRLNLGSEPATTDNPAWLLSADSAPSELAPWSALELASSPACSNGDGYRAVVQTDQPWIALDGSTARRSGMTALVRWSGERVCLEAVELSYRDFPQGDDEPPLRVFAVARFVGTEPGSAFIGAEISTMVRESTRCELLKLD